MDSSVNAKADYDMTINKVAAVLDSIRLYLSPIGFTNVLDLGA